MRAFIIAALLSMPVMAFDYEEMQSVVETSCEIRLFSRLRLQDEYKHVFPPKWKDKVYIKQKVSKCVKEIFDEFRD